MAIKEFFLRLSIGKQIRLGIIFTSLFLCVITLCIPIIGLIVRHSFVSKEILTYLDNEENKEIFNINSLIERIEGIAEFNAKYESLFLTSLYNNILKSEHSTNQL